MALAFAHQRHVAVSGPLNYAIALKTGSLYHLRSFLAYRHRFLLTSTNVTCDVSEIEAFINGTYCSIYLYIHSYIWFCVEGFSAIVGTDAGVALSIKGSRGFLGATPLENDKDNFERKRCDEFSIRCLDLGDIESLTIGHDNRGSGPAWHLARVEITNVSTGADPSKVQIEQHLPK
jgi:hypothetical protein